MANPIGGYPSVGFCIILFVGVRMTSILLEIRIGIVSN